MKPTTRLTERVLLTVMFAFGQFLLITLSCVAQNDSRVVLVAPVAIDPPAPALEAKAEGEVKPFKRTHSDLKASVMAHPIPEATLVFTLKDKKETKVIVQLPEEAKKLLKECWHAELMFYYLRTFEIHDVQTRIKERMAFGYLVGDTHAKLQELTIDTPTGRRKISLNEAVSLTHLLNNSAQCVVNEAKDSVGAKPIAGSKTRRVTTAGKFASSTKIIKHDKYRLGVANCINLVIARKQIGRAAGARMVPHL